MTCYLSLHDWTVPRARFRAKASFTRFFSPVWSPQRDASCCFVWDQTASCVLFLGRSLFLPRDGLFLLRWQVALRGLSRGRLAQLTIPKSRGLVPHKTRFPRIAACITLTTFEVSANAHSREASADRRRARFLFPSRQCAAGLARSTRTQPRQGGIHQCE
jgi:hypothetical protein